MQYTQKVKEMNVTHFLKFWLSGKDLKLKLGENFMETVLHIHSRERVRQRFSICQKRAVAFYAMKLDVQKWDLMKH
jgi:hypothetical protein